MRCRNSLKIILALFILGIVAQSAHAQDFDFKVMANRGQNKLQRSESTNLIALKTGSKINSGDLLIASQGAYIGLMHNSGKTLEIKEAGTYSVPMLRRKLGGGTASISQRYMNFVMNKINNDDIRAERDYRKDLRATGAVERAVSSSSIRVRIRETKNANKVYGQTTTLRWEEAPGVSIYVVTVRNIFNQQLMERETTKSELVLDFTEEVLAKERFIIFNVRSKSNEELISKDFGIQRISPNQAIEFTEQLNRLRKELGDGSALNKIVLASYFEENRLLMDALTLYEEAIGMSPEVEDFKLMYEDFLDVNGIGN